MRVQDDIDEMGGGLTDMYQPKSSGKGNGRSVMSKLSKKDTDEERHRVVATILIITYRQVPAQRFICSQVKI